MLDSQTTERMYIDAGEIVRVRVESDEFYDHEPGPPPKALEGVRVAREQKKVPYTIIVSHPVPDPLSFFFFANWSDEFLPSVRLGSKDSDPCPGGRMPKSRRWTKTEHGPHFCVKFLARWLLVPTKWGKKYNKAPANMSDGRRVVLYSGWIVYRQKV